jgi:hypothetical protein
MSARNHQFLVMKLKNFDFFHCEEFFTCEELLAGNVTVVLIIGVEICITVCICVAAIGNTDGTPKTGST